MTTEIARLPAPKNECAKQVIANIDRFKDPLPSGIEQPQFLHALVVASNELTKECTPNSVLVACYNSVRMGLPPGKAMGLSYFVPFWDKNALGKNKGGYVCTLIPGYRGYLDLSLGNNFLAEIETEVLLKGETYHNIMRNDHRDFFHDMSDINRDPLNFNNIEGAYVRYKTSSGGSHVLVMNRKQIDNVKKDTDVWKYHYDEMAMKTVIRRAAKRWKLTPQLALAVALDDAADKGLPQTFGDTPGFDDAPPESGSSFDDFETGKRNLETFKSHIDDCETAEQVEYELSQIEPYRDCLSDEDVEIIRKHGATRLEQLEIPY